MPPICAISSIVEGILSAISCKVLSCSTTRRAARRAHLRVFLSERRKPIEQRLIRAHRECFHAFLFLFRFRLALEYLNAPRAGDHAVGFRAGMKNRILPRAGFAISCLERTRFEHRVDQGGNLIGRKVGKRTEAIVSRKIPVPRSLCFRAAKDLNQHRAPESLPRFFHRVNDLPRRIRPVDRLLRFQTIQAESAMIGRTFAK